jgi:uncharacterized protein YcfL
MKKLFIAAAIITGLFLTACSSSEIIKPKEKTMSVAVIKTNMGTIEIRTFCKRNTKDS